jgi:hypothetical protein
MKLTTTAQVSVDGVTQGPGTPVAGVSERGAFERSGWAHFGQRSRFGHASVEPADG